MRLCRAILSRECLSLISRSLREHDLISFRLELSFELGFDFRREFQSVVQIVQSFCQERPRCPVAHAAWNLLIIPDELWDLHSTCPREDGLYLCKCLAHLLRRAYLAAYSSALVWFNGVF